MNFSPTFAASQAAVGGKQDWQADPAVFLRRAGPVHGPDPRGRGRLLPDLLAATQVCRGRRAGIFKILEIQS